MKSLMSLLFTLILAGTLLQSCSNPAYEVEEKTQSNTFGINSTEEKDGNRVADIIRYEHNLDIVLYPTDFLRKNKELTSKRDKDEWSDAIDEFALGTMKGKDIKSLIIERSMEKYENPFYVSGLKYHIHFVGGLLRVANFARSQNGQLEDEKLYKVAISQAFYDNRQFYFPNYEYKNGLGYSFRFSDRVISVEKTLENSDYNPVKDKLSRSIVSKKVLGNKGELTISKIQGDSFLSPIYGYQVTTSGIVTAIGEREEYPKGTEFLIQSPSKDEDPKTSEALKVYLYNKLDSDLKIGDFISVTGIVYEPLSGSGLSSTEIREVKDISILESGLELPKAAFLTKSEIKIPNQQISKFQGNLNDKRSLDLNDTIDFFESIEHMRVKISKPRVLGFRGGREDLIAPDGKIGQKNYVSLYVRVDADTDFDGLTSNGGLILDEDTHNHNPEVLHISTGSFSRGIDTKRFYKVGDILDGEIEGVFTYSQNLFGDGEYVLMTPTKQDILSDSSPAKENATPLEERAKTTLKGDADSLTISTYNIENLGGNQDARIKNLAISIKSNLRCPDIVNLVEIQDNNSDDFSGTTEADLTLKKIIDNLSSCGFKYAPINIDPVAFAEGGQPGGSIRVAMIYNKDKLKFNYKKIPNALEETVVTLDGSLSYNPGRVFPNDKAFSNSRRSIVSEFEFKGKKIFIIGNHFNSKLGDRSLYGALQPFSSGSETRRIRIAAKINQFVRTIEKRSPGAGVVVLGDFNANIKETSMSVLKGNSLINLIEDERFVNKRDRYTTNHNGTSQALDYIFSNKSMHANGYELEVLNINSDFMGRISDHDPLVAKYYFP